MINTCRESLSDLTPAENHNQTVLQKKADMEELEQLERTIVSGLETFKAVGLSLSEIHNRRLYKLRVTVLLSFKLLVVFLFYVAAAKLDILQRPLLFAVFNNFLL